MTASKNVSQEDWYEPQRDTRGRFLPGSTGNPSGRPRKPPKAPWSVPGALADVLRETVVVTTGQHGAVETLTFRDLLIKSLIRRALKAKPKDLLFIIERLLELGAFNTPLEEEDEYEHEEIFTEEDKRLLEMIEREVFPQISSQGEQAQVEQKESFDGEVAADEG